jgi:hypothetical protein
MADGKNQSLVKLFMPPMTSLKLRDPELIRKVLAADRVARCSVFLALGLDYEKAVYPWRS